MTKYAYILGQILACKEFGVKFADENGAAMQGPVPTQNEDTNKFTDEDLSGEDQNRSEVPAEQLAEVLNALDAQLTGETGTDPNSPIQDKMNRPTVWANPQSNLAGTNADINPSSAGIPGANNV
jgi:hypothetical protein